MNRICLSYRSSTGQLPNLATKGLWILELFSFKEAGDYLP